MFQRIAADILKLPNSLNGHVISASLLTSFVLSVITIGLVGPAVGYYQLFLLIVVGPLTFIHHITIICLLRKRQKETTKTSLVPTCLTRKTNVGFMVVFELIWLSGVVVGFWFYAKYHSSADMVISTGLAVTSNTVALLECLAFPVLIVFCIRARNETVRAPWELDLV
ncbi:mannosyltransferase domain protein, partial [Rhizoctonia solani 123E]